MSDIYTYPSEQLMERAIKELKENPKQVNAHIESFRRWVKSMPHLKCPTDSKFLLMFLRVAKFDHEKAQRRLDNFCTIRSTARGHPELFEFPDINDPVIANVIRSKMQIRMGLTNNGEVLYAGQPGQWDPKEIPTKQLLIVIFMGLEMGLMQEEMQVNGMKYFSDMHNCGKAILDVFSDPKVLKKMTRVWQDCYPVRIKGNIIYREPAWYSVIMNIFEFFLHDKHKKRMYRIKDNLTKAFEKIDGLERMLPSEYGGKGESFTVLAEKHLKDMQEFYKNGSPWASISVDESKRPAETSKYLVQYADYDPGTTGTKGCFTKLDAL